MLVPRLRKLAAIGLIALLVAVFPANLQMAAHPELYADLGNALLFYLRLPLQLVLIAWVWWGCGLRDQTVTIVRGAPFPKSPGPKG